MTFKNQAKRVNSSETRRNYEQAKNNQRRLDTWNSKKVKRK